MTHTIQSIDEQRAEEAAGAEKNAPQRVTVVAIDISIGDLMVLYIRAAIAALPVALLFAIVVFLARLLWRVANP